MTRKTKRRQADSTKRETLQDCPDGQPGVSERMEIDPPSASGQGARLEELYTNLRDEVRGAAEELIVQFVPLVNSAVMGFISRRRGFAHLHDDLISEGYLSMTETVLGLKRPHDLIKDVRAYVLRAVYNAMDDHCNASHQVAPSVRTQYRKRNELDKKEIGQLDPEGPQDFGSEATKRVDEILGDIRKPTALGADGSRHCGRVGRAKVHRLRCPQTR
jgi:hypothetical protein